MRTPTRRALTYVAAASMVSLMALTAQARLERGNDGPEVITLQQLLRAAGYGKNVKVDGEFGIDTRIAVRLFQKDHKLKSDGVVGGKTWRKLIPRKPKLELGDSGKPVRWLQTMLRQNGEHTKIDEKFGGDTQDAVRSFQRKRELRPDGDAGRQTWDELFVKGD